MKKNPQQAPLQNSAYQAQMAKPKFVKEVVDKKIYRLYPPIGSPIDVNKCQPMMVTERSMTNFLTHNHYRDGGLFVHANEIDQYLTAADLSHLKSKPAPKSTADTEVTVEEIKAPPKPVPGAKPKRTTTGKQFNAVKKYLTTNGVEVDEIGTMSLEELLETWEIPEEITK